MSFIDKLPIDILIHIYCFDTTYREIFKESLKFIEHAVPSCTCCGARKSNKSCTRWSRLCWNACHKHNPSAYYKNGEPYFEYLIPDIMSLMTTRNYSIGSPYYQMKTRERSIVRYYLRMCWLLYYYSERLRLDRLHNNTFRNGLYKKQSWSRFMDMSHNQRTIVA